MNKYEKELLQAHCWENSSLIAGCDEVGRGCLAGPLVVGAVILPKAYFNPAIKDSKVLSASKRAALFTLIKDVAISYALVVIDVREVEKLNPKRASIVGMERAIAALTVKPDLVLTDAEKIVCSVPQLNLVKGDMLSQTIGAASILAKVTRDLIMDELACRYPAYDWIHNKGYGTSKHLAALRTQGYCVEHRRTYSPIRQMVENE